MNKQFSNIELISPQDPSYIANNRKYSKIYNQSRKHKAVDPFQSAYNKALKKWEHVMQRLLSLLTTEVEKRILKYSGHRAGFVFREIDFISQPSEDKLIFCELKLKKEYKHTLRKQHSGWAQLDKSISIASQKYNQLSGLAICVDMSHVYGIDSAASENDYCKFKDLVSYLLKPSPEKQTIWLNSLEVSELAMKDGLLTSNDISQMRTLYVEQECPLSVLSTNSVEVINNPFTSLKWK